MQQPVSSTVTRGPDVERSFSYDEIGEKSEAVRSLVASLGIKLNRESALARLLRDAEAVVIGSEHRGGATILSGPALVRTAHANRVTSAILDMGSEQGADILLRKMTSGDMDLGARGHSPGKDALWEIELAARLRLAGFDVKLAEPDLILDIAGESYGVACKKVHSEQGVPTQFRKGVHQLERARVPGLVAFNLDDLTPAASIFVSRDTRSAGDHLAQLNRNFVDAHQRQLERYVARRRCHGVLATTTVVADLEERATRINTFSQTTIWTLSAPHTPTSAAFLKLVDSLRRNMSPPAAAS